MLGFRDWPITRKLTMVIMGTSTFALALAGVVQTTYEFVRFRQTAAGDLMGLADIVAENSAAALAFQDVPAATETLRSLTTNPDILAAVLYRSDGGAFAQYLRPQTSGSASLPMVKRTAGQWFENGQLVVCRPVVLERESLGMLCVCSDLRRRHARMMLRAATLVGALVCAALVALVLSRRLQRAISQPILELASMTERIGRGSDYALRAVTRSQDELGLLTDGFNQMLMQIQKRDAELRASEERFRQLAENIHEVFWMTDSAKQQMIYVSPAYAAIFGRSCDSLYRQPQSWLEAVHPEERARVRAAALTKQAGGGYDEEYRIIRPDGAIRWIRDRAFPVSGPSGPVYRVVGIAEDITDRKRLEAEVLQISEREQHRIGQDLHDGLCQHLLGTALAAQVLTLQFGAGSPTHAAGAEIVQLLKQAIEQARALARGLTPVQLEINGLAAGLRDLVDNVQQLGRVSCVFHSPGPVAVTDNAAATHLYRIAQEAVNNALKHAHAKAIRLELAAVDGGVRLEVADDGVGLTPPRPGDRGLGLSIMAYRARMLGGTLEVRRGQPAGTVVSCFVPVASGHDDVPPNNQPTGEVR